jgi:2-polyprenyl-6-hydroxyphenyl methylase/3-demethylubiquinone-9 3-methyltransferase
MQSENSPNPGANNDGNPQDDANAETSTGTNVDPAEIEKFSALASRWWDTESEFKTLHDINPLRVGYIDEHCGGLQGKQVLDIGCGGGILAEAMAAAGAEVTGIDMAEMSLDVARMHLLESGLKVPDPSSIINAAAQALKPGGTLVLSTLNRNPKSFLLAIVGAEYIMNMLPKGTHEYARFLKPSELAAHARQAQLDVCDVTGMSYNPLSKNYRLGQDVDVNYLMTCRPA